MWDRILSFLRDFDLFVLGITDHHFSMIATLRTHLLLISHGIIFSIIILKQATCSRNLNSFHELVFHISGSTKVFFMNLLLTLVKWSTF